MKRTGWAATGLWVLLCMAPAGCAAGRDKRPALAQDTNSGSPVSAPADRHKGRGRVRDADGRFSIVPPPGWKSAGPFMGSLMTYAGPLEGGFAVCFNALVQKDSATPEEVLPKLKALLGKTLTEHQAVSEGFTTIDDKAAYRYSCKFVQGQFTLQTLQYGVSTGTGKFYVITFTAPVAVFEKYRPLFEATAKTARMD